MSSWSMTGARADTGVFGFRATAAIFPASWIMATARTSPSSSSTSACTFTRSAPASMNQGISSRGLSIMRCTSQTRDVAGLSDFNSGTPMVRLGTKWPSMTSMCTKPAPAASIMATSSPRRMKSADRREGAIFTGWYMGTSLLARPLIPMGIF